MDDEEQICGLATQILTRYGHSVTTVLDGDEAIAIYREAMERGKPFDVVIMDLTIPGGIGGTEALQALLAIDPHVRAIVSSGYAEDPVMADPTAYGFKEVIAKPYTSGTLREVVARVLA